MHPVLSGSYSEVRGVELLRNAEAQHRHHAVPAPTPPRSVAARQAVGLALVGLGLRVLTSPAEALGRRA